MSLYRSLSHETFLQNLELNFDHMAEKNPFMMVVLGNFNTKSKSWYANDSTNFEGSNIDFSTSSFCFHQIINKPTDILNNSSSCIDLIITTQSNLVMESVVHSSLHANYHHQLPYAKFNLNVFYPPPTYDEKSGLVNLRILIAFKGHLKILIGKKHFSMLMLTKKSYFLMKLY